MSRNGNRKLRIGIIGAGGIVKQRHLPAFKRRSDLEIVAISNSTYESAEKFCQENVPGAVPIANWPDLVALPDIDVVWIGTPRSEERRVGKECVTTCRSRWSPYH